MKRLEICPLPPGIGIVQPDYGHSEQVRMDTPAIKVMTHLTRVKAVTTQPQARLDFVHQHMIANGVRMVLVIDAQQNIIGVLTATDLLGPTPLQKSQELRLPHNQLLVEHVMTPARKMDVVYYHDVTHADVAEIVATLREVERQHIIVVDNEANPPVIRGIFSLTQIERQLGMHLEPVRAQRTLIDLQKEISA